MSNTDTCMCANTAKFDQYTLNTLVSSKFYKFPNVTLTSKPDNQLLRFHQGPHKTPR